ncbi:MAG: hypothetical protein ACLFUK_07795 [Halanaerobium sp.]
MYYWGHHNGVNKFRPKDNPRYISAPNRDSRKWKKNYNKRTIVERTFFRLEEHLNLEN